MNGTKPNVVDRTKNNRSIDSTECISSVILDHQKKTRNRHKKRLYHASRTIEQRIELNKRKRNRYSNRTEEQRNKRKEYVRTLYQNKIKVQGLKKELCKQVTKQCVENMDSELDETILKLSNGVHPLRDLILEVIIAKRNVEVISHIDEKLLVRILKMFAFVHSPDLVYQLQFAIQRLYYAIDKQCLIEMLKKWHGWGIYDNVELYSGKKSHDDLFGYLNAGFTGMQHSKDYWVTEELKKFGIDCDISVSCSFKELRTIFTPPIFTSDTVHRNYHKVVGHVWNWPHISIQIKLPNFSMTRQNIHVCEYYILDVNKDRSMDENEPMNTSLFCEKVSEKDTFLPSFVLKFLTQLRFAINNRDYIGKDKKIEMASVLGEFTKDILLCTNTIETNTKYYKYLCPYPYRRFLSDSIFKSSKLDVALQQTAWPKLSFVLEEFNLLYVNIDDDIHFVFDELFLRKVNSCIHYKCLMCDEDLGSCSTSIHIHMFYHHGLELHWKCSECHKWFDTNYLSLNRWWHSCRITW